MDSSIAKLHINPEKVRFPEELVYFVSEGAAASMLLNPELGTFTKLPQNELASLKALRLGNQSNPDTAVLSKLIIERVLYYGDFKPVVSDIPPPVPKSVYWETTHGCSLRCSYCYMSADTVRPGELSTEEAMNLIKQVAELGSTRFVFTGGEAMVRKDIFQLGAHALSVGLGTEIITNATLITTLDTAKKVKENFNHVVVSLDGACPEHNDVHRGFGSFEQIVRGMKLLNEAGVSLTLNSTLSERNVEHTSELYEFVEDEFDVKNHRMLFITRLGRGDGVEGTIGKEEEDPDTGWNVYHTLFEHMRPRLQAKKRGGTGVLQRESYPKADFKPKMNCGMGSAEIYVDSQGQVYPCKLITTPEWSAGNIRESTLKSLIQTAPISKARNHSVMNAPGCRSCIIRRLCGGGCRGFHLGNSGDALKNDPYLCWTLRHGKVTEMWLALDVPSALNEDAAFVPRLFSTDELWNPEIGTALPNEILTSINHHIKNLAGSELPLLS